MAWMGTVSHPPDRDYQISRWAGQGRSSFRQRSWEALESPDQEGSGELPCVRLGCGHHREVHRRFLAWRAWCRRWRCKGCIERF